MSDNPIITWGGGLFAVLADLAARGLKIDSVKVGEGKRAQGARYEVSYFNPSVGQQEFSDFRSHNAGG